MYLAICIGPFLDLFYRYFRVQVFNLIFMHFRTSSGTLNTDRAAFYRASISSCWSSFSVLLHSVYCARCRMLVESILLTFKTQSCLPQVTKHNQKFCS